MGQHDLASNSLTSYADVFADIINAVVYGGKPVLLEQNLKPFYLNSAVEKDGRLKGLYRDNCMEDIRNRIRYAIWGLENQYVPDRTTPFKSMGYTYTAYDRQIEEFLMRNKETHNSAYVSQLHPDQKLVPVITLVLYYGKEDIPEDICSMIRMPEDEAVRKYIQNYSLNLIRLRDLSQEQAEAFRSDFSCIAKFLSKSYTKREQMEALKTDRQMLTHARDTLHTLAAVTGDQQYLQIYEKYKHRGGMEVSEVAEALYQWGCDDSRAEIARKDAAIAEKDSAIAKMKSDNAEKDFAIAKKDSAIAEKDSALMEQQAEIERLHAEIRMLKQAQGQ